MKRLLSTICLLISIAITGSAADPYTATSARLVDSLYRELGRARYGYDSIRIYYNIFDLTPRERSEQLARKFISCADANNQNGVTMDIIRRVANYNVTKPAKLDSLMKLTRTYKESVERSITETFIGMLINSGALKTTSDSLKVRTIHHLISNLRDNPTADVYKRIVTLHAICTLLADGSQEDLLVRYTDHLGALIESLPSQAYAIRNCFYVQASINYAHAGRRDKSIASDRKLLEIMREMEKEYARKGRDFVDYAPNRYIVYTRILSNFEALTPEEIERYYAMAIELTKTDKLAGHTYNRFPYPDLYYALAHKDYSRAMELLTQLKETAADAWKQRTLLKYTIQCADTLGMKDELIASLREYSRLTDAYLANRFAQKYMEIPITYEMFDLEEQISDLSASKDEGERRLHSRINTIAMIAGAILLVMVIVLCVLYRRAKSLSRSVAISNDNLIAERDKLAEQSRALDAAREQAERANQLRSNFIKNLAFEIGPSLKAITEYSHIITDLAADNEKEYMKNFVKIIDLNCDMLNSLATDVLTLSDIENSTISLENAPADLNSIIPLVIETAETGDKKQVEVTYTSTLNRYVQTDIRRFQQVMLYILSNALKFTDEGTVTVKCDLTGDSVTITVADTGPGIDPKYKEKIFERFFKVSRSTPGAGLGLHIARQLARLLGGDLRLDTSYTTGARFIFTIPLR